MDGEIELIAVPVTDVDKAITFYRDQVGVRQHLLASGVEPARSTSSRGARS